MLYLGLAAVVTDGARRRSSLFFDNVFHCCYTDLASPVIQIVIFRPFQNGPFGLWQCIVIS